MPGFKSPVVFQDGSSLSSSTPIMEYRGSYSAATAYAVSDVVVYNTNTYVCVTATTAGQDPVAYPAKWTALGSSSSQVVQNLRIIALCEVNP